MAGQKSKEEKVKEVPGPVPLETRLRQSISSELEGVRQSLQACVDEETALNKRLASVRNRAQQLLGAQTALQVQLKNLESMTAKEQGPRQ